ncbi:hypothetical protein ACFL16_00405 [Patescibacteria group bacterium]
MGFKLVDEVDCSETEKVSLEKWKAEFEFWSNFAQFEQKIKEGDCPEEPMLDELNGYCDFFNRNCLRCSLSKYQVTLEGEDGDVTDDLCNEYGGIAIGCLMEHDFESLTSAVRVRIEALKRDGIRWGYYKDPEEK